MEDRASFENEEYIFNLHKLRPVFLIFICVARPGDEVKVAQSVKDFRSHSLPIMKPPDGQSPYILTPREKVAHESLGRRESIDLLVSSCFISCHAAARHTSSGSLFLTFPALKNTLWTQTQTLPQTVWFYHTFFRLSTASPLFLPSHKTSSFLTFMDEHAGLFFFFMIAYCCD